MTPHRLNACLVLALAACTAGAARAGDLFFTVEGVKNAEGRLMLALYDSAEGFLRRSVKACEAQAANGSTTVLVKDLPAGSYGFAVFHDANGNGKMDSNVMGIPVEDHAFSNNARGTMGPPTFEQVKFSLPAAGATARISLR